MVWDNILLSKKELIYPIETGIFGSIVAELWKLKRDCDVYYISNVVNIDNHNLPVSLIGEKIGKSFEEVKEWTIIKFPEFKEVL